MKKRNLKIGLIVLLVMLMLGLTYTSFAFWDQLTKTDNITVNIGEGKEITLAVEVDTTDGVLIPNGKVLGTNEVYSVTKEFTVTLDNETQNDLNLSVDASDINIGGDETYEDLVIISIDLSTPTIQKGAPVTVTVTIQLEEPSDSTSYGAIYGKTIAFTLKFAAKDPSL